MKKITALCLSIMLLTLTLCACGGSSADDSLGKYICTSIVVENIDVDVDEEWIELQANGKATLYMMDQTYNAEYTLEDTAFSMTIDGQAVASGTLENGTLQVDLLGMACVFEKTDSAE